MNQNVVCILTIVDQQTWKGVAIKNYEDLHWNKKEVESPNEVRWYFLVYLCYTFLDAFVYKSDILINFCLIADGVSLWW